MANKTNMGLWPGNRNQWSVSKLSGLESGAATPRIKGDRCLISNAVFLEGAADYTHLFNKSNAIGYFFDKKQNID